MAGMRIDNHSFMGMKGSPKFPKGVHEKDYSSAEGSGMVMKYEDTTEAIKSQQEKSVSQAKKHPMKPGYRY